MTATASAPRIDERAMGAGTTVRFVLLLTLLLVSSGSMMQVVARGYFGGYGYGCLLAAGGDPTQGTDRGVSARIIANHDAYWACVDRYEPAAPWWLPLLGLVLVAAVAVALFLALPHWKIRRDRLVPLDVIDHDGEIGRRMAELAAVAGLARVPRIVVDLTAVTTDAVVFGSDRRPIVCLHGGLVARRTADPDGFRARAMHEFAHIRNRDLTITYATVVVWRVFVVLVLLPYVVWYLTAIPTSARSPFWPGETAFTTRGLLLPICMILLVYLARSDVLRSREIHADLAATRWGADLRSLAFTTPAPVTGRLRRALGSFVELWRMHPRWTLRRDAVTDPAALFGVQALPMFLTGAAAPLIDVQVADYLPPVASGAWLGRLPALLVAGLVTGVAGIALWRAVVHAVLTGRRAPSGVRAGLWLGAGAVAGELVLNRVTVLRWFPDHPVVLALVLFAGVAFAWWTAQCAELWVRAWPGRTIRPAMLLGLTAAWLVLFAWFVWWQSEGALLASSGTVDPAGMRLILRELYGASPEEHPAMQSAIGAVWPFLTSLDTPLVLSAVMALWVVPLLTWTFRPTTAPPSWTLGSLTEPGRWEAPDKGVPLQRRVLPVVLLGIPASWAAVAVVMGYMHTWQPPPADRGGLYALIYQAWTLVALVAAAAAAAAVASVPASRHRLLVALITAEVVALGGLAGRFVFAAADGCFQPLNTLAVRCHWLPDPAWTLVQSIMGYVLVLAAVAAVMAAGIVSAARRLRPKTRRATRDLPPDPRPNGRLAARRAATAVLCAAAVAAPLVAAAQQESPGPATLSQVQQVVGLDDAVVSAEIRQLQVKAWWAHGGWDLRERYRTDVVRLSKSLNDAAQAGRGSVEPTIFGPLCSHMGEIARDAGRYFDAPDQETQAFWRTFITQAGNGGRNCRKSLDDENGDLFITSMHELIEAGKALQAVTARMPR
ncbi:M48 family metalloprotease [Nonomuraea sp. NPDC049758]|uniref:M48 family metalloprotease n=1 Tax=Nonomuraea sp. NPDC049758 TaxID=3154360 RepID=UPI00342ED705